MKPILALLALIAIVIVGMSAFAADDTLPNDPNVNPDANACYTGGAWEGKCGDSGYFWEGGWYLIRFYYGLIPRNQFPDQYKWALPPEPTEEPSFSETPEPCFIELAVGKAVVPCK